MRICCNGEITSRGFRVKGEGTGAQRGVMETGETVRCYMLASAMKTLRPIEHLSREHVILQIKSSKLVPAVKLLKKQTTT